jgi:hypothetical protein
VIWVTLEEIGAVFPTRNRPWHRICSVLSHLAKFGFSCGYNQDGRATVVTDFLRHINCHHKNHWLLCKVRRGTHLRLDGTSLETLVTPGMPLKSPDFLRFSTLLVWSNFARYHFREVFFFRPRYWRDDYLFTNYFAW